MTLFDENPFRGVASFCANHYSDHDLFFPRSYDMSSFQDLCAFFDDYMNLKAEAVLTRFLNEYAERNYTPSSLIANVGVIKILCCVIQKYHQGFNEDSFIDGKGFRGSQCFNELESLIVYNADKWIYENVQDSQLDVDSAFVALLRSLHPKKEEEDTNKKWNFLKKKVSPTLVNLDHVNDNILSLIKNTIDENNKSHPQETINGSGASNNLWIVKPAGKSRGRGIQVFQKLESLLQHIKPSVDGSNSSQFIVQKYIENPLLMKGKKWDIRQWILVTGKNKETLFLLKSMLLQGKSLTIMSVDWNPLTVWFYNDCYIRFAVDDYDGPVDSDGKQGEVGDKWTANIYRHLVNNSIGKRSCDFRKSFIVEETHCRVNDCMMPLEDFQEWYDKKFGEEKWHESLAPAMKRISIDSLLCAQEDMMTNRKRCFEIYGLDFMVDNNLQPWLIEVNSSPACDYSTSVTEAFLKRALPDTLKVVLKKDGSWNTHQTSDTNRFDTGGWEQIYRGSSIPKLPEHFGSDLILKATPLIRKPKLKRTKSLRPQKEKVHVPSIRESKENCENHTTTSSRQRSKVQPNAKVSVPMRTIKLEF